MRPNRRTPHCKLRPEHIRSLYQRLIIAGGRRGGPLSAKTVTNLHRLLHPAPRDAVERGLLPANPAAGVRPPDPRRHPSDRRQAKSWTATELGAFIAGTADSQHSMLFRLTAATGMRRGEILGLRWDDVHFDTSRLEITQALISIDYQLVSPDSRREPAAATSPSTPTPSPSSPTGDMSRPLSSTLPA